MATTAQYPLADPQYSIIFVNNTAYAADVCVYQTYPNFNVPGVVSLAWLAQNTGPNIKTIFSWTFGYNFFWSETSTLAPGAILIPSQVAEANLTDQNQITLTNAGFQGPSQGRQPGSLYINVERTTPASAGIGMAGWGTIAMPTMPNITLAFTPPSQYWITFGTYTRGEVLDINQIANKAEIVFPVGIYSMTAILNKNNTWTVEPTSQVNAKFVETRRINVEAKWGLS